MVLNEQTRGQDLVESLNLDTHYQSNGLGGVGDITRSWVDGLTRALLIPRLAETTLLSLRGRVPVLGLLSSSTRHCPVCARDNLRDRTQYHYLIWCIKAVVVCPVHECPLEEVFSPVQYRRAHWRPIVFSGQPDLCPQSREEPFSQARMASELQRARLVAAFLECTSFQNGFAPGQSTTVSDFLLAAIEKLADGKANRLARHLEVSKGGFHDWIFRKHVPSFEQVLDIAQALDCSLEAVVGGNAGHLPMLLPDYSRQKPRQHYVHQSERDPTIRQALLKALQHNNPFLPPPSLSAVARQVGIDRKQLNFLYPKISLEIRKNRKAWQARHAQLAQAIHKHAYREAAIVLAQAGVLPTRNRVMDLLEGISVFSTTDRAECQEICYEVRETYRLEPRRGRRQVVMDVAKKLGGT